MVRVLKESESEIKNKFEIELKALRKIDLDEDYSPGEESFLTFELDTEGLIDINKIRKYMEFDKYYPDNNIELEYVDFDDWFIDEHTGENAWVSIKFKLISKKPLDIEDCKEIADSLIDYLVFEHLRASVSGIVVYYTDKWDYNREDIYEERHVDEDYSETIQVHIEYLNSPIQIEIISSSQTEINDKEK